MNWDAVGAIGETVGAIAVVVTLIYLAFQIRQQNRESRIASVHELNEAFRASISAFQDPGLADVFSRAKSDFADLGEPERLRFIAMVQGVFRVWEDAFYQFDAGRLDPRIWQAMVTQFSAYLSLPGVQASLGDSQAGLQRGVPRPRRSNDPDRISHQMTRALMEPAVRPLTEREVRRLGGRLRAAEKRERSGRTGPIVAGASVSAVLWALTLLASDAPAGVITVFWLAVGGGITVWVLREHGRELAGTVEPLRSALRRREAEEYRFAATEFAEVEEAEDEGAAYAFQIVAGRLAFVVGQEFYPEGDFPSLDFSIVYAMAEGGHAATMDIESRADRGTPSRKLPARFRFVDDFPEHLEVRTGTIENLERILDPDLLGT